MSGKNKTAEQSQQKVADAQTKAMERALDQSESQYKQRQELQAPLIDWAKGIASGDFGSMLTANAIPLENLGRSFSTTRENIFDSTPRGAARDFALAELERDKGTQSASLMNNSFLSALQALGQLGTESGNFSLQSLGGGISAGNSASSANQSLMDAAAQRKASTLGAIGSLGGMATSALTGGMAGGLSSGGGGGFSSAVSNLPLAYSGTARFASMPSGGFGL